MNQPGESNSGEARDTASPITAPTRTVVLNLMSRRALKLIQYALFGQKAPFVSRPTGIDLHGLVSANTNVEWMLLSAQGKVQCLQLVISSPKYTTNHTHRKSRQTVV